MSVLIEPELILSGGDPVPRQLEGQIRRQILDGVLLPGEELPTVRCVAVGLSVNPHAVEEAYGRLERQGFLTSGDGGGLRVAARPADAAHGELDKWCRNFLGQTAAQGYSLAEVLRTLHAWIDRSYGHGESQ